MTNFRIYYTNSNPLKSKFDLKFLLKKHVVFQQRASMIDNSETYLLLIILLSLLRFQQLFSPFQDASEGREAPPGLWFDL